MFKLLRLFLPLLLIVFVLPMLVPGPNGKPVMSPNDWLPNKTTLNKVSYFFSDSKNKILRMVDQITVNKNLDDEAGSDAAGQPNQQQWFGSSNKLYKWQDAAGQWHFSDDPKQAGGRDVSQQLMPVLINQMPPMTQQDPESAQPVEANTSSGFPFSPTSIPVGDIPKLIEDTKKIRAQLEQRNKTIEEM